MNKKAKILLQLIFFILPWRIRKKLLCYFFEYEIKDDARIGRSIILSDKVIIEKGAGIDSLTFVNNIDILHMKPFSRIGRSNWITGANSKSMMFKKVDRQSKLTLGYHTRITANHHLDCTGGINIDDFTTVAGLNSQILTHSIDIKSSSQTSDSVNIGKYCFVGTSCIILMGSNLPDYSVLGAGSVLNKKYTKPYSLYAGNPARLIKEFNYKEYSYFFRDHGHVQ